MAKAGLTRDRRDLEIIKALGALDLPSTKFWGRLGLAGRNDVEFRTLHGNRDALIVENDRFQGNAHLYLFMRFTNDEGRVEEELPIVVPVRYSGRFENSKPVVEEIELREKSAA